MIPNNISDLIKASQDNREGVFDTVSIGDLLVDCLESLDAPMSKEFISKPFQSGISKTDVAVDNDRIITMTIILTHPKLSLDGAAEAYAKDDFGRYGETWVDKRDTLIKYFNDKEIITVQTHDDTIPDCVIQEITPLYDSEDNYDAYICNIILEQKQIFGKEEESGSGFYSTKKGASL